MDLFSSLQAYCKGAYPSAKAKAAHFQKLPKPPPPHRPHAMLLQHTEQHFMTGVCWNLNFFCCNPARGGRSVFVGDEVCGSYRISASRMRSWSRNSIKKIIKPTSPQTVGGPRPLTKKMSGGGSKKLQQLLGASESDIDLLLRPAEILSTSTHKVLDRVGPFHATARMRFSAVRSPQAWISGYCAK